MSWWDSLTGRNRPNYYINNGKGLVASHIDSSNAGGLGTYGYVKDSGGNYIGVNEDAYNILRQTGTEGLYTSGQMKDIANASGSTSGGLSSLGAIGSAAQGLAGLASAYTGYKNYQLAKDQFETEKAYAGANLYNQGTLINNQIRNAAEVGQALAGNTMTADQRAAGLAGLANKYVKTAV